MNENLRAKIAGRLDDLSDELGRQLLDYMEFLVSKHNRSRRAPSTMQRIAEGIEDRLGTAQLSDAAAQVVDVAGKVVSGLAAAGKAVAEEFQPNIASADPSGEDTDDGAGAAASDDDGQSEVDETVDETEGEVEEGA